MHIYIYIYIYIYVCIYSKSMLEPARNIIRSRCYSIKSLQLTMCSNKLFNNINYCNIYLYI